MGLLEVLFGGRPGARELEVRQGQLLIVVARWLLVLAGLLVALWEPDALPRLRVEIGVLLLVATGNFVMHAQLLRRRPTIESVAMALSAGDLVVITLLVANTGGAASNVFVFYFPAVLAISLAFPTAQTVALSALAVGLACGLGGVGATAPDVLLVRGLMLAGVAVVGNASWRLHRTRIQPSVLAAREAAQDLFWGQAACLWARWCLIAAGAVLVLVRSDSTDLLAAGIGPVVLLLVVNFYLHGRYLLERPANRQLTLLAGGLDLVLVMALALGWPGLPGLESPLIVLLYPLVLAISLVFAPRVAWSYGGIAVLGYATFVLAGGVHETGDLKTLVVRCITLAAMAGLGSLYWRSVRREARLAAHSSEASGALAWQAAGAR